MFVGSCLYIWLNDLMVCVLCRNISEVSKYEELKCRGKKFVALK
jgi:hypothetical protein